MLRFLLARDTMHQRLWLAAIDDLKADGIEDMPVPEAFPDAPGESAYTDTYLAFSAGGAPAEWAGVPDRAGVPRHLRHRRTAGRARHGADLGGAAGP